MKKVFLFVFTIIFLFVSFSFSENNSYILKKFSLEVQKPSNNYGLEIILFEKPQKAFENLAKKMTGADYIDTDSIEYVLVSGKENNNFKLKIRKYSFLWLELSLSFK